MKSVLLFISIVFTLCFTACTGAEESSTDTASLFESVKLTYGLQEVSYGVPNADQVPSVSTHEMRAVLEALRLSANKQNACLVEQIDGNDFGGNGAVNKKVVMGNEYVAKTTDGSLLEAFLLRVELKFNIEQGQVYYYGTDYLFSSSLFDWRANGLSLSPAKNKDPYTYEFESESFLYFRVKEEANCLLKVGISFKGAYNFLTQKGTYSFQLERYGN